jgi:hypothetical protein
VNVVPGYGTTAGNALALHGRVAKLSFTGSVATGRAVLRAAAASNLKRVTLELGGKSPLIVCADADLDAAADRAFAAMFFHNGQVCSAGSRLFVHASVHDALVARLVERARARAAKPGVATDPDATLSPLVDSLQFERVKEYIQIGVREVRPFPLRTAARARRPCRLVAVLRCMAEGGGGRARRWRWGVRRCGVRASSSSRPSSRACATACASHARRYLAPFWSSSLSPHTRTRSHVPTTPRCVARRGGGAVGVHAVCVCVRVVAQATAHVQFGLAAGVVTGNLSTALTLAHGLEAGTVWVNTYGNVLPQTVRCWSAS